MYQSIKILNKGDQPLPAYATEGSSGLDLMANVSEPLAIASMERMLVPTGIYIEMPTNIEAQIRPRSGLALKSGITLLNSPGTIDSDYRGEIKVILINLSKKLFVINKGDRIAQLVFSPILKIRWNESESINDTQRSTGGFGHTGFSK